jgi:membrane dipeptidase
MQSGTRRRFLKMTGVLALGSPSLLSPSLLRAATDLPVADAHSHIGMFMSKLAGRSLKAEMDASGVTLLSWTIASDARWTVRGNYGIEQRSTPAKGEQASYFRQGLDRMRKYLAADGLRYVQQPADIDAAKGGVPHVVIAAEGAGFTEDDIESLDRFYADGLRHVQVVHYIRNALGDFQTERPQHNGMTGLGVDVVKSCNRLGILVDLAHATNPVIDKALETSSAPMIWSHSALTSTETTWRQSSNLSRKLYIDQAKKIAQRGGAVGLWALRNTVGDSPSGYANELMRMVDAIGPEHVMFGTDLEGMGQFAVMEKLEDLRKVADLLRGRGVDDKTLRAICFDNYARCLRAAMEARKA